MRSKRSIIGSIAVSAMAVALTMGPAHGQAGKDEQPGKPASASDKRALATEEAGRRASSFAASKGALGSYYDGSKDQHVVVVSRGSQTSAAEASRAIGAAVRIEQRDIAKEEVDRFQAKVAGRAFHGDATRYSYASYFDVTTGKLVLDTDAPAAVIESLSSEFAATIEVRAGGVTEDFSRRADTSPFWGGSSVKSNGWTCTTGFVVKKSTGTRYLLTAGHCFEPGWNVYTSDGNLHVGSVVQKAPISSRDMELIGGKSYGRSIFVGGTNSSTGKIVEQASDPVVNFVGYCRSGQTTGEQCGHKVTSVSANFCPTSGCKTNVIAYTTGGASASGDSGAPFYINSGSNVQARGIHVGRNTSTGTMYAEKWSVIAATLGVSIVT